MVMSIFNKLHTITSIKSPFSLSSAVFQSNFVEIEVIFLSVKVAGQNANIQMTLQIQFEMKICPSAI